LFDNLKIFLQYRKQNKIVSKALKIKRDRKIEIYLLLGLWKNKRFENFIKRNCRCFLSYYEERGKEIKFNDLNYIISRFISIYNILGDEEILNVEINNFDNVFNKTYVENKVKEILNIKNDARKKNLVFEAVN